MHMSILTNTHTVQIMHTQRKGDILHKDHAHTHTLLNTSMLAVMEPEENGKVSISFLFSDLERMSFFFSLSLSLSLQ